jgi:hypothetical protein
MKRGQIVTFEFSLTLIAFIIFVIIATTIIIIRFPETPKSDTDAEYVFANLENNLAADSKPQVLQNYRAIKSDVENFWSINALNSVDKYVLDRISLTAGPGIGLTDYAYDVCWYYTDTTGSILPIITASGPISAIGQVKDKSGATNYCNVEITAGRNPCANYTKAVSVFQPTLWDEGTTTTNRIIQMNLVLCKE